MRVDRRWRRSGALRCGVRLPGVPLEQDRDRGSMRCEGRRADDGARRAAERGWALPRRTLSASLPRCRWRSQSPRGVSFEQGAAVRAPAEGRDPGCGGDRCQRPRCVGFDDAQPPRRIDIGEQVCARREPRWGHWRRWSESAISRAVGPDHVQRAPRSVGDAEAGGGPARVAHRAPRLRSTSGACRRARSRSACARRRRRRRGHAGTRSLPRSGRAGAASRRAGRPRGRAETAPAGGHRRAPRSAPAARCGPRR